MKPLSKMTKDLIGQPMFKQLLLVQAKEEAGRKIHHFEIGDSDFLVHSYIKDAVKRALDNDHTHYVDSTGIPEFKAAICNDVKKRLGFLPSHKQILVMPSNAVIDFVVRCVANPGDEVICPDPGFSTYIAVTNYTAVKRIGLPLLESNRFHVKPDEIEKRITDKTRLIILNSPSNPTGAALTRDEILQVASLAKKYDIYILSDEIYSRIIYDSLQHYSPSELDQCKERTIILDGFSKAYSMSGFRLGYAVGPRHVIKHMGLLFQTIFSCFPPFIQYGGISVLTEYLDLIEERRKVYEGLRNLICERLNSMPGVSCLKPEGALYVFPNITETGMSSRQFAEFALEKADIALSPGTYFGGHGEGYVRLCFARNPEMIIEAMDKLKTALEGLNIKSHKRPPSQWKKVSSSTIY